MKSLCRHKTFIKYLRNVRLTDSQATKLFLYVAKLLNDESLPPEAKDHALQGEWGDFRELHLGGDMLLLSDGWANCLFDPFRQPRPTFQKYVKALRLQHRQIRRNSNDFRANNIG